MPTPCEQLLEAADPQERERLLDLGAGTTACAEWLLDRARRALAEQPQEALRIADLAVIVADRSAAWSQAAQAWRVRAQALRANGRHAEALPAFEAAAASAQRGGDARLAAQVQIGRIDSLGALGRYDEALTLARRLEAVLRAEDAEADAARVLYNAGGLLYRRDRYAEALDAFERAHEVFARQGDTVSQARAETNCANVLTMLNRVEEAITLFQNARETFVAADMLPFAAMVDANTGYLHYISGRYSEALAAFARARQEFAARGQVLETAKCDADMADVYRALNLYPEALERYERSIPVFANISLDYERARAELGRAAILMATERPEAALEALANAEGIFRAHKNAFQSAHVRLIRAYLLRAQENREEARAEAALAARALTRRRLPGWAAEARFLLADMALEEGEAAVHQMRHVGRVARVHARSWLACRAERAMGLYYARQADSRRALRHFRAAVAALEEARTLIAQEEMHVAFLRDKLAAYEDLVSTLLERGRRRDIIEALEHVERAKSRLLLERVQAALESRTTGGGAGAAEARARLEALRAQLSREYHRLQAADPEDPRRLMGSGTATAKTLRPLERAYQAALHEWELATFASATDRTVETTSVLPEQLPEALGPDEILIEFYISREKVSAFIIQNAGIMVRYSIASLDAVLHAARRLRFQVQRAGLPAGYVERFAPQLAQGVQSALRALYDLLLKPLEPWLTAEKVVVIPHGILHGLPFHAFWDGAQYALDRWEFVYAPSAAFWHAGIRRAATRLPYNGEPSGIGRALLVGVPGPGIERVADEVTQLAALLPQSKALCQEQATLAAFQEAAADYRVIHLATHALFRADNPLFSGLQFADGWLLARDLYEMNLDCDLATLSACRTGMTFVEAGDELFGLLRGFLAAGVRSLVASLWPADDEATAFLMVRFYQYLTCGASRSAALRTAQQETRRVYPHPYHWAAFALVGAR